MWYVWENIKLWHYILKDKCLFTEKCQKLGIPPSPVDPSYIDSVKFIKSSADVVENNDTDIIFTYVCRMLYIDDNFTILQILKLLQSLANIVSTFQLLQLMYQNIALTIHLFLLYVIISNHNFFLKTIPILLKLLL